MFFTNITLALLITFWKSVSESLVRPSIALSVPSDYSNKLPMNLNYFFFGRNLSCSVYSSIFCIHENVFNPPYHFLNLDLSQIPKMTLLGGELSLCQKFGNDLTLRRCNFKYQHPSLWWLLKLMSWVYNRYNSSLVLSSMICHFSPQSHIC